MRSISKSLVLSLLLILSNALYSQDSLTAVAMHGNLQVVGTKITGTNHNKPVQLRGMSMFWSQWSDGSKYYKAQVVNEFVEDWKASVIRASMGVNENGTGYISNPTVEKNKIKTVVDACIAKGIYVIIDWHSHTAFDEVAEAKAFFAEMAQTYGNHPNVIYEIFNEPQNVAWATVIKPYCQQIIDTIRIHDADNLIICGTRNWSQRVDEVASNKINDPNVAYTLHYYSASHKASLRTIAQTAINSGVPIFVTEFGTCEASGAGKIDFEESKLWWDFLEKNDISWCNWSVSDKAEAASALTPKTSVLGNWTSANYTTSGAFVRDKLRHSHQLPVYQNNMRVEIANGYQLLYSDTPYLFDISVFNADTLVPKDSVKFYLETSSGGTINENGFFTPNGTVGSFKLFIELSYDTLRTSKVVDFLITDVKPSELTNKESKTFLALTLENNYRLNTNTIYPSNLNLAIPQALDSVSIENQKHTWKITHEPNRIFAVSDTNIKSYLAIYVTNPVERSAKISVNQRGKSSIFVNGKEPKTNAFNLLKGENIIVIEYTGTLDTSFFDFEIMDLSGDTMTFLSYTTAGLGTYDCNKTWRGTAYLQQECGCIGGNTGIAHCPGPYLGFPALIPGTIQAENYDFGPSGIAYFDKTVGNSGDSDLRSPDDVDISVTNDLKGIASIGWIEPTEWLKYTVNVSKAGKYIADVRIATALDNCAMQLQINNTNLFAVDLPIPNTTNWTTWKTINSDTFLLEQGVQELKFLSKAGFFNINFMTFRELTSLGINKEWNATFSVFPNPYSSSIQLVTSDIIEYEIVDLQGIKLEQGVCDDSCNLGAALPKGMYLLVLKDGYKLKVERIIKK